MFDYHLGEHGRALMVMGGVVVVVVVAVVVVCAVAQPCLLHNLILRGEERRRFQRDEKRPLVHPPPPPQLKLHTPNSKRPSDPFVTSSSAGGKGGGAGSSPALASSPHSPLASLLGALASKRDSTYSSMSEQSVSPLQSGRNSLCDSTGYASLVGSPNVDCASPLPHATGQISFSLHLTPAPTTPPQLRRTDRTEWRNGEETGGRLTITVKEARGLSHPHQPPPFPPHVYVRVLVWRERRGIRRVKTTHLHIFRTRTVRHNNDPAFNESFVADIGRIDPKEVVVRLVVESLERWVSCPTVLGELTLSLRHLPSSSLTSLPLTEQGRDARDAGHVDELVQEGKEEPPPLTYCLSPPLQDLGNVLLSASFLPTAQRLSVCIIKAADLRYTAAADSLEDFYPYVRVLLLCKGRLLKKKKTGYCSSTDSPQWNQTLLFSLTPQQVDSASVVICVCSRPPSAGVDENNVKNVATGNNSVTNNNRPTGQKLYNPFNDYKRTDSTAFPPANIVDELTYGVAADSANRRHSLSSSLSVATPAAAAEGRGGGGRGAGRRTGERYVGKVVLGSHVRVGQSKEFYRAIIQAPRTQHTQWHPLK